MIKKLGFILLLWFSVGVHADEATISIAFVGDVMLDETPGQYIKQGKDPFKSFEKILAESDLRIANLECVVSGKKGKPEDKPYALKAHPRVLPVLKKHFSAVSLANNHSYDYGEQTFLETLSLLEKAGLPYLGGGRDIFQAHEPKIFNVKGKKIALLAYNEFHPRSFEALADRPGVAWSEDEYVVYGIQRAREFYGADYVITYPHWGVEQTKTASPRQVHLARLMIDAGADAVVGGHPHVTQNIETYKGKPIFYSLGNFVFNGFTDDDSNTGWLVQLFIKGDDITWLVHEAKIDKLGIPKYSRAVPVGELVR
jgi:poly-gamma-glutamate capsule biosynthesis protein CapA/YwtB (metallophosphatase superfamily)